jgi:KipI family sensor histidine kinase inhibitor
MGETAGAGLSPRVLRAGDDAVLLEFASADEVAAAHRGLLTMRPPGVAELVPAARTLLVSYDPGLATPEEIGAWVRSAPPAQSSDGACDAVRIPVRYDGVDLENLSALLDMGVAELVRRHTEPEYVVAFCGFAPGFAYLTGLDPRLRLPRLAEPRTRVPAGSVAVADEFTGVYPAASPGGWRLLGTTDAVVWDVDRDPPALLSPGTRVRFEAVGPSGAGR